jgi:hypothetical protein
VTYRGRRAATIENGVLRVTPCSKKADTSRNCAISRPASTRCGPPHWPSIEPSAYDPARHPEYGGGADASLLAGLIGHNLCLDIFGGPSAEEAAAGFPVHGETSVARFAIEASGASARMHAVLPSAQLRVERHIGLDDRVVVIRESVENLASTDRPVGWTQHVTIGPPFLEKGRTEFDISGDRSMVFPGTFGPADYLQPGAAVRLAARPARRRRRRGSRPLHCRPVVERIHRAPHGRVARRRVLHRLLAGRAAGVRLHVAAGGLPVARAMGGKPQPHRGTPWDGAR